MSLPGPMELIIILIIVALLFGTKKIRSLGGDLGGAIKNFKGAINENDDDDEPLDKTIVLDRSKAHEISKTHTEAEKVSSDKT